MSTKTEDQSQSTYNAPLRSNFRNRVLCYAWNFTSNYVETQFGSRSIKDAQAYIAIFLEESNENVSAIILHM